MAKTVVQTLAILFAIALSASSALAEAPRLDGNWWQRQGEQGQVDYVIGYMQGSGDGAERCSYESKQVSSFVAQSCRTLMAGIAQRTQEIVITSATSGQVADGLKAFYADYRNRRILLPHALGLVKASIEGMTEGNMTVMVEEFRKKDAE